MITMSAVSLIDGGTAGAGLVTAIIGILSFCGRRSLFMITFNLCLLVVLFCGFVCITVFYWTGAACDVGKEMCEEINKIIGNVLKFVLLGTDALVVRTFLLSEHSCSL